MVEAKQPTFFQMALNQLPPRAHILDLGAGDGFFSRECLSRGASVVAVDRVDSPFSDPNLDWHSMEVQDYIEGLTAKDTFDLVYSRNLIQFLHSSWVYEVMIPRLKNIVHKNGIIAIQTFYQDPEPPFDKKVPSLYSATDLAAAFSDWQILHQQEYSHIGPDRAGGTRKFFLTEVIAKNLTA